MCLLDQSLKAGGRNAFNFECISSIIALFVRPANKKYAPKIKNGIVIVAKKSKPSFGQDADVMLNQYASIIAAILPAQNTKLKMIVKFANDALG